MGFFLYQVDSLLKKAYEIARKEMSRDFYRENEDGQYVRAHAVGYGPDGSNTRRVNPNADSQFNLERIPHVKPGEDMGHDLAMVTAERLSNEAISRAFSMSSDRVFSNEYQVFILKATLYMAYRGIPVAAMHQQETTQYYFFDKNMHERTIVYNPGHGVQTGVRKATLIEAALRAAGIPLYEPATQRTVDDRYGIVWSPADGKVKESYVEGVHGKAPISPGNTLFTLEVWDAPSLSRGLYVIAQVGGDIGKVSVKRGQMVSKGDEMVRLRNPWVSSSLSLPHGTQAE